MSERLAWIVVGAVTAVWVLTTLILPLAVHGYAPPPSVGTVMGSLAGGAGAFLFAKRNERGKHNDEKKPRRRKPRAELPTERKDDDE